MDSISILLPLVIKIVQHKFAYILITIQISYGASQCLTQLHWNILNVCCLMQCKHCANDFHKININIRVSASAASFKTAAILFTLQYDVTHNNTQLQQLFYFCLSISIPFSGMRLLTLYLIYKFFFCEFEILVTCSSVE